MPPLTPPSVVTLVAARSATTLSAAMLARVCNSIRGGDPVLLSPGEAADIPCMVAPSIEQVTACLDKAAIDIFILPVEGRRKRLLLADMDSTIVTTETLDEIAAYAGLKDQISAITMRAMNGEIDFKQALRLRVGMLKGLGLDALQRTWEATELTDGAQTLVRTMKAFGAVTALVSGGFTFFSSRVAKLCGFDLHRSNRLEDDGQSLTGFVAEPILDRDAKLAELRRLAAQHGIGTAAALTIGDGANDLPMLKAAGLGIAFHAKPIVAAEAAYQIRYADLRAALFAQGYRAQDFIV